MELFFDASEVDLESSVTPKDVIPDGFYTWMIVDSEPVDSKNGDKSIKFSLGVAKGEQAGKIREEWIARRCNANPKRVAIGEKMLARFIKACGKEKIRDTKEIHNIPFTANLVTKGKYQNITDIAPYDGEAVEKPKSNPGFDIE